MLQALFHAWERRLASVTTDRVVRPFEWGLDWIPQDDHAHAPSNAEELGQDPRGILNNWVSRVMADTDAFFTPPPTTDYELPAGGGWKRRSYVPKRVGDAAPDKQHGVLPYFPARSQRTGTAPHTCQQRPAVLVLPQWNAGPGDHAGLCRLLAWNGMSALRLSLPYHDERMPPELHRADYIVSANVARTVQVCRQAVLDARRAIAWLAAQGYDRIGILGTSLGSCLALLTTAHEPLIGAEALNHISPHFADVVWRGLSTRHVRGTRRPHRARSAARAVAADQPALVSRAPPRSADAARLRAVRSHVPGRSVRRSRARVPRHRHPPRGRGRSMRPLQHRQDAVQIRRWLGADAVLKRALI